MGGGADFEQLDVTTTSNVKRNLSQHKEKVSPVIS